MLLKRLLKAIRERLLKLDRVRRTVAGSLKRLEEERQAKHLAILLHSGKSIRDLKQVRPFGMGRWRL